MGLLGLGRGAHFLCEFSVLIIMRTFVVFSDVVNCLLQFFLFCDVFTDLIF